MSPDSTLQCLVDAGNTLGECPLWCERTQTLYWTDIEAARLHAWQADGGLARQWAMPERVGSFALCQQPGQLLLGLASGIALFNLNTGGCGPLLPVEADEPRTRINDGRCDAQGRFVFGMFNQAADAAPIGHFYRVDGRGDAGLQIERLALPPVAVANAIAFSPDGGRLYFTDSPSRQIWCVDYPAAGPLGVPQPFARVAEGDAMPDGAAVDADGGLWCALWEGGCVLRFGADGQPTDRLALAARRATCPAFGGPALDTLFVTSARVGLDAAALAAQPQAGALFAATGVRRGLPERRFATALRV